MWRTQQTSIECCSIPHSYALGGFDGRSMVSSVEVYDPRMESWIFEEPMERTRGYAAAGVINESIYVIGGLFVDHKILDTVSESSTMSLLLMIKPMSVILQSTFALLITMKLEF